MSGLASCPKEAKEELTLSIFRLIDIKALRFCGEKRIVRMLARRRYGCRGEWPQVPQPGDGKKVEWLADEAFPGEKTILGAHNCHVGADASDTG